MARPDFIDISMLGDKRLQRKIKKIDIALQRKYVRQSMRKGMTPVKNRAVMLAPVDRGKLKKSIKLRSKTKSGISRAFVVTGTRQELGIDPGEKWYYPAAIEYGYRKNGRYYAARSFMRKALSDIRNQVIKRAADHIGDMLQKNHTGRR